MIGRAIIFLLAFATFSEAATRVRSPEKLRSLSMLPTLEAKMQITSHEFMHPELCVKTNDLPRQIAVLEKQLRNDPSDAERYETIGSYLTALKRKDEATKAMSNAANFYRIRAEAQPQNGPLQTSFAQALMKGGQTAEAEQLLRAVVHSLPDDWKCWAGLGDLLDVRSDLLCVGDGDGQKAANPIFQPIAGTQRVAKPLTRDESEMLAKWQAEADKCFDRAVSLGDKQPQAFVRRAMHRTGRITAQNMLIAQRNGEQLSHTALFDGMSGAEVCADFATATRLAPTNYLIAGYWGWVEAMPVISSADDSPISRLPASRRNNLLESIRVFEKLCENSDPKEAAGALEYLGIMQFLILRETSQAQSTFRRAVAADSSRAQAWQGLLGLAVSQPDPRELVSVCEDRLKHDDTPRNRVAAAKACDRAQMNDKALEHARKAVKLDGNDPAARICLGALLLRRPDEEKLWEEISENMLKANELLTGIEHDEQTIQWHVTLTLNVIITCALYEDVKKAIGLLDKLEDKKIADEKASERMKEVRTVLGN